LEAYFRTKTTYIQDL